MSTFPGVIRFAFLRIKKEHPRWGTEVARPRVAERMGLPEEEMPNAGTIERYWAKFKDRLYKRHRQRHPLDEQEKEPKPKAPHQRW